MSRLTKAALLAGPEPEPFAVPALGGQEVLLRQLSAAEAAEVEAAQLAGIEMQGLQAGSLGPRAVGQAAPRGSSSAQPRLDIDFEALVRGSAKANHLAAHYGLADPELTLEEVQALRPAEAITQIAEEVLRRSGLEEDAKKQLERFRGLDGGPGHAAPPSERGAAGTDAGPADSAPEELPARSAEGAREGE